ncbi:protein-lysine N-methyltransferase EEF2KMT-like [Asterias amurensis]|uniref:protein-lysine N-methyltransferase EEF2KMT-like n=1 Tax=Asterias amurensis TaxID=7602 RepID=UPI003AB6C422
MTDFKMEDVTNLSTVSAQFLAMSPVRKMGLENADELFQSVESQTDLLKMTIKSAIAQKHPPSVKYQEAFLKTLIQQCEAKGYEIGDELYEVYTALLSNFKSEANDECYRTYLLSNTNDTSVTLKESVKMISEGTTGLNTWPAAGLLAEWAMENKDALCGRTILELGSGMGLTGLTICKTCQPARYIFSDCHDSVLKGLEENIAINVAGDHEQSSVAPEIDTEDTKGDRIPDNSVECIDWKDFEKNDLQRLNAGVILAADVVFDPRIIEHLVRLLRLLLRCQGDGQGRPTAYIASTIRNEATYRAFLQALDKHHVSTEKMEIPAHKTLHFDRSCRIQILRLWLPGWPSSQETVCGQ